MKQTLDDLFASIENDALLSASGGNFVSLSSPEKEETRYETTEDLLVISCHIHRTNPSAIMTDSPSYDGKITAEDREYAARIHTHFMNKLTLQTLKNEPMSAFRKSLSKFLTEDFKTYDGKYKYPHDSLGMAFKLPEFYEYDKKLEEIAGGQYRAVNGDSFVEGTKQLQFMGCLPRRTRLAKSFEFWFTDLEDNLVMLPIMQDNPLYSLFLEKVEQGPVRIRCRYKRTGRDTISYYKAFSDWKFA